MNRDTDITWNWPDNAFGTVQQAGAFESERLGTTYGFGLYLPPSYRTSPTRRYPVVYWLHGYTSRPHYAGYVTERLHAAITRGEAPELIVIAVNGLYSALFCDDASGQRPVEAVIMQELLPHVDATYRTIANRTGRALEGFSRGGFAAAHLAFKYPDTFGALSMLAGAFHTADELPRLRPSLFQDYFGGNYDLWKRENAWDLAAAASRDQRTSLPMRMLVGTEDTGQYAGNRRYHEHLEALGFSCPLTIVPGVDHTVRGLYDCAPGNPFSFFNPLDVDHRAH